MALVFRLPPIYKYPLNSQLKTGGPNGGEYEGEAQRAGGVGEAGYHCFGGALELNGCKNLK